jgi:hypothetical protein
MSGYQPSSSPPMTTRMVRGDYIQDGHRLIFRPNPEGRSTRQVSVPLLTSDATRSGGSGPPTPSNTQPSDFRRPQPPARNTPGQSAFSSDSSDFQMEQSPRRNAQGHPLPGGFGRLPPDTTMGDRLSSSPTSLSELPYGSPMSIYGSSPQTGPPSSPSADAQSRAAERRRVQAATERRSTVERVYGRQQPAVVTEYDRAYHVRQRQLYVAAFNWERQQ